LARRRSIISAALNIRIHPHSEERYVSLFRHAFALRLPIAVRGDQRMLLQHVDFSHAADQGLIIGSIARFVEIDFRMSWFDFIKLDVATDEDVGKIEIPENLRPNYRSFYFEFLVHEHMFVYEQYGPEGVVSPRMMFRFIDRLLNSLDLLQVYGPVSVSVMSDREQLDEIIALPDLKRLRIFVKLPNPDDLGRYDAEIEARLRRQNATSLEQTYKSEGGASLAPDDTTMALADVATRNGEVQAEGYDAGGRRVTRSTNEHPALEKFRYDPDTISGLQAFISAANGLMAKIRRAIG